MTDDESQSRVRNIDRRKLLVSLATAATGGLVGGSYLLSDRLQSDRDDPEPEPEPEPERDPVRAESESIRDHGGIEGSDSLMAIKNNTEAIHRASKAADNNVVYLPEGEWFIGAQTGGNGWSLLSGYSSRSSATASLGFVGDGPERSFLKLGRVIPGEGHAIKYGNDTTHPNVVWKDLTYDGRYDQFDVDYSDGTAHWGFRLVDCVGDFTFENVRIQNWAGNGFFMSAGCSASVSFDQCSFYNHGIGVDNDTNGRYSSHAIRASIDDGKQLTITNSEFRLTSGNHINLPNTTGGRTVIKNCYAEGAGTGFMKLTNQETVEISNLYFKAETPELLSELSSEETSRAAFFYRLRGNKNRTPEVRLSDVQVENLPSFGWSARGLDVDIRGGRDGPVTLQNVATREDRDSAIRATDGGGFSIDFGQLSVHDVSDAVFDCVRSNGNIDLLTWGGADELGNMGSIAIENLENGDTQLDPAVPSRQDVGVIRKE